MQKKLARTTGSHAMLFGVCGGLGNYFDLDPTIVRLAIALFTLFSFGSLILVYLLMAIILPKEEING